MSTVVERRPRAGCAGVLGEAVHDRVAAVAQDDEQHADAVRGRAPQRLDLVERGAVADDRDHGAIRQRQAQPDGRGQREAEHPHRADEPAGRAGGDAGVQLGAAGGRLLDEDRVGREAARPARARTWPGVERLAGLRGRRRAANGPRTGAGSTTAASAAAHGARVAEHGQLGRAAVRLLRVGGDRPPAACLGRRAGPGRRGTGAARPCRPRAPRRTAASTSRRRAAAAPGRGGRRTADGPAGSRPRRRTAPGTPARPAARPARSAPAQPSARRPRRDERGGARRRGTPPARRRPRARRPRSAPGAPGRGSRAAPARARASRPSARSRAPGRGRSRPRGRRGRSRPARPARAPAAPPNTGYSPASPCSRPARNGSCARWRRSCWPTITTSGTRFRRAVASAATALPSPGVLCRSAKAGSPRPDRVARRPCRPPTPRAAPARTAGRPAGRRGTAPRCCPGWRRSSSAPADAGRRRWRRGRSARMQEYRAGRTTAFVGARHALHRRGRTGRRAAQAQARRDPASPRRADHVHADRRRARGDAAGDLLPRQAPPGRRAGLTGRRAPCARDRRGDLPGRGAVVLGLSGVRRPARAGAGA